MFRPVAVGALLAAILVAATFAGFRWWMDASLHRPLAFPGETYTLMVERGSSLSALARRLAGEGLTPGPLPLQIHARLAVDGTIHAGEYRIERGETLLDLVDKLLRGDVILHRVTFPEGRTLDQWLAILAAHPILGAQPPPSSEAVAAIFGDGDILAPPPGDDLVLGRASGEAPEGWFFPDTYSFPRDRPAIEILREAHVRMKRILAEEWRARAPDLPIETPYEALILASIVEKETGVAAERGQIAGVFTRRLDLGMRLQTDPTVIYGLGERFQGNLTREHLGEDTAYNTYRIDGLPPTPIANPGREAIRAALNPEPGSALYFVARGDGSHQFSDTLADHQKAVREYQLKRRQDYRSSPAPATKEP
ncbi:MAG: endolytic transglycosylase MltG [Pseudomonadota bacterium]|nr:endolytic transglycosylase MltG [Pseudomonadota bacterium]